jgi:hypothetical protein
MTRSKALKLRAIARNAATALEDSEAVAVPELFKSMSGNGAIIKAGTRICWNKKLVKAINDIEDIKENAPDANPALWEVISTEGSFRMIPEVVAAAEAFAKGTKGWWKDELYESIYDGDNVWNPEQFVAGWKKLIKE